MTLLGRFLIRLIAASAGLGVALLFPLDRQLVLRVYLLVAAGLALESLVRTAAALEPRRRRGRTPRLGDAGARPAALVRLEDQVALAVATAADLHYHLRPVLREIAEARGLDEAAAGEAWELVRPDREPPRDAFARGFGLDRLGRVVDALERP